MLKIGDKVMVDNKEELTGYIVKMEYDPLEPYEAKTLSEDEICYTVRVYKSFWSGGYYDFGRMGHELCPAPVQLSMFDMLT